METPPLGLAEAFIAVGARTVVQKMWYDEETALVDTVRLKGVPPRRFPQRIWMNHVMHAASSARLVEMMISS